MSLFRTAPVTAECLVVFTALYVVCTVRAMEGESFAQSQREWGAAVSRDIEIHRVGSDLAIASLSVPTELWNGEWWRIPLSAFHHFNIGHLLFDCTLVWALGERLERRWGSIRFTLFLLPAVCVPLLVEFALGNVVLGFSGALCAMFGAILAIQQNDSTHREFSEESAQAILGLILLGIPLTATELVWFPNAAHVSGVLYGWFAGRALCRPDSLKRSIRIAFVLSHFLLVPLFWLATHPISNGRYLWYLSTRSPHRIELLKMAIDADPSLSGVWLQLSDAETSLTGPLGGWSVILQGLSRNPADVQLNDEARRIWMRLKPGTDRESAEAELHRVFGPSAAAWSNAIRQPLLAANPDIHRFAEPPLNPSEFPLDRPIDLRWEPKPQADQTLQPLNPEKPDSAVEGQVL